MTKVLVVISQYAALNWRDTTSVNMESVRRYGWEWSGTHSWIHWNPGARGSPIAPTAHSLWRQLISIGNLVHLTGCHDWNPRPRKMLIILMAAILQPKSPNISILRRWTEIMWLALHAAQLTGVVIFPATTPSYLAPSFHLWLWRMILWTYLWSYWPS